MTLNSIAVWSQRVTEPAQDPPKLVGIVNVTEDSFSDGGRYLDPKKAIEHARGLVDSGADVIELGPASSHPDARLVPPETQIARLDAVLSELRTSLSQGSTMLEGDVPISVDATHPEVLGWAAAAGVAYLNDVRGFATEPAREAVVGCSAALVVMHSLAEAERATREAATPSRVLDSIEAFFDRRLAELVRAGVSEERLIIDPGMGFFLGRDPLASVAALQRIPEWRDRFGRPILVSVSRKSFLRTLTNQDVATSGAATLAAEIHAARLGARFIRTHDVAALADGLAIEWALSTEVPRMRDA